MIGRAGSDFESQCHLFFSFLQRFEHQAFAAGLSSVFTAVLGAQSPRLQQSENSFSLTCQVLTSFCVLVRFFLSWSLIPVRRQAYSVFIFDPLHYLSALRNQFLPLPKAKFFKAFLRTTAFPPPFFLFFFFGTVPLELRFRRTGGFFI